MALQQLENQITTNLIGPMNVTRAVLPIMCKARSGHIISISSLAGLVGFEYNAAYARRSSVWKAGWNHYDVAPFGIKTTIVEPGFFRTELLEPESTTFAELSIDDYAERDIQFMTFFKEVLMISPTRQTMWKLLYLQLVQAVIQVLIKPCRLV
ncbi:SDR family NAD(P)-dependent oxidoreductase [Actinomycetes bacterium NPDC127524]